MTGFSRPQRWTRSHERFVRAWERLHMAHARRGMHGASSLQWWLERNFDVARVIDLTVAQARKGRRSLNAWRGGMEGRVAVPKLIPTAASTATRGERRLLRALLAKGVAVPARLIATKASGSRCSGGDLAAAIDLTTLAAAVRQSSRACHVGASVEPVSLEFSR